MNKHATNKIIAIINNLFKTAGSKTKHINDKISRVAGAVVGLIENDDVSLFNLARYNNHTRTINYSSLEQNARRMLDDLGITQEQYATVLVHNILELKQLELTMDRTNWKDGVADINYFVISVIWHDMAIPLYWYLLDNKGGSSSDQQRISLVKWVVDVFGADMIACIYADREFPSNNFLGYLLNDKRKCNSYLELDHFIASKFYAEIKINPAKLQSAITIDNNLPYLKLEAECTIIDTGSELFLANLLENNTIRIYPLAFHNQYNKIKQTYRPKDANFEFSSCLLASMFRDFVAKPPVKFLQRCKSSHLVSNGNQTITLAELFKDLHRKQSKTDIAREIKRIFGSRLYVSAKLNYKNEFIFIVSSHFLADPFTAYKRRWFIETMFGKFKSMGFNLENTHIKNLHRLKSIFMLISIAYLCCCKLGQFIHSKIKPIKLKKLLTSDSLTTEMRLQFSVFRLGFELLKNFINNHLFSGAIMAKLIHKILDYNIDKLKLPKRSKAILLLRSF